MPPKKITGTNTDQNGREYGIYLPPLICRDRQVSPAARICCGQIAQLARKHGYCSATNSFLAEQCGLDRDTVSAAISRLIDLGHLEVTRTTGGRRRIQMSVNFLDQRASLKSKMAEQVDCARIPQSTGAEFIGADAENSALTAENSRGHLNREVRENEDEELSSSFSRKKTTNPRPSATPQQPAPPGSAPAAQAISLVKTWATQAANLIHPRVWRHLNGGTEQELRLGVPSPGIPSAIEITQAINLAKEFWPGSDPTLALRQLLRAAAWIPDRRDRLQQYAFLSSSGSLGVRAILRLGGKEDRLGFAREAAGAVPRPPMSVPPGNNQAADQLLGLAYGTGQWGAPCWRSCWLQAAGLCSTFGVTPQYYMAAVIDLFQQGSRATPVPWLADSVIEEQLTGFAPRYREDRRNAWRGGLTLRDPEHPNQVVWNYDDFCIGHDIAVAAANGRQVFRSRRCLLCCAAELAFDPDLMKTGADKLRGILLDLAAKTHGDDPPIRGKACGQGNCGLPSYIRCQYGESDGVYSVGVRDDEPPITTVQAAP